jgi:hypothetical protein
VRLNPDLLPDLERIIQRALENDRELRSQHASDRRSELLRLKRDTDSSRHVSTPDVGSATSAPTAERVSLSCADISILTSCSYKKRSSDN